MADFDPEQIKTMAIAFHEIYTSFVGAGFTESQAIHLVSGLLKAAMEANRPPQD